LETAVIWNQRREERKAQPEDARGDADIDYARVVHSASFRRLQGKTQILNLGDSDFYRTRLTHSLEVAQIAEAIGRQFRKHCKTDPAFNHLPDISTIRAIALSHDLGHPPFGHGGEVALNYCMRNEGGFEGNGQTLRILSKLEKFSEKSGSNMARRTLLGVLKYPLPFSVAFNPILTPQLDPDPTAISIIDRESSKPPKCYLDSEQDVVDWILEPLGSNDRDKFCSFEKRANKHHRPLHRSFDSSIMNLADDIAFGVHDLEDVLALGLISEEEFRKFVSEEKCSSFLTKAKEKNSGKSLNNIYENMVEGLFGDGRTRKRFISRMVHHLVVHTRIKTFNEFDEPLIRYRAAMDVGPKQFLDALQIAVRETVICSASVQHLEFKGQKMVVSVFEALSSEPKSFLPRDTLKIYQASEQPKRVICDHIAGMTDTFLLKTYDRLFSPRMGSVFDRL
jgi:dGTPase